VRLLSKVAWFLLFCAVLLLPRGGKGGEVTLEAFADMLKATHPAFSRERLVPVILATEQDAMQGVSDWNLSGSLGFSREEPTLATMGPERTDALSFRVGVTKRLWSTGGELSVINSLTRSVSGMGPSLLFSYPKRFYEHSLEVQYTHPLLRNRSGRQTRLAYFLKRFDVDAARIEAEERLEEFLADAMLRYLDWVYLEEQHRRVRERLDLSSRELERMQRKFDAYLVDSTDVLRASDAVSSWKQNLGLVSSNLEAIKRELGVLVQDPGLVFREPGFDLYRIPSLPPIDDARKALADVRVFKVLQLRQGQLGVSGAGLRNASKPDLSIVGAVAVKDGGEAFAGAFNAGKTDAALGLQLQVPLENTVAKSDRGKHRLEQLRLGYEIEEIRLSFESSLASLHEQLWQLRSVLRLNREQIASAKLRTSEEVALYETGRGDLTFVIMSRDNEEAARLTYAENAVRYQKLWIRYLELLDRL